MNDMKQFTFEGGHNLSALEKDGLAWFVAADVCKALGLQNPRQAVSRLDEDERGVATMDTPGGRQQVTTINESGLYSLILTSRKAEAKLFKKWVTAVVLPSIRNHGGYVNGMESLEGPAKEASVAVILQEVQRVGLCLEEEKEARREAFRIMKRK
jgi:prophage antirepressor-like protein